MDLNDTSRGLKVRFSQIVTPFKSTKQPVITPYPTTYVPPPVALGAAHRVHDAFHTHRSSVQSHHVSPMYPTTTPIAAQHSHHASEIRVPETPYPYRIDMDAYTDPLPKPRPLPLNLEATRQAYPASPASSMVSRAPLPPPLNAARSVPVPAVTAGEHRTTAGGSGFGTRSASAGRYPSWTQIEMQKAKVGTGFAASGTEDLGASVLHDVLLSPEAPFTGSTLDKSHSGRSQLAPTPPPTVLAAAATSTARAAQNSTQWLASALKGVRERVDAERKVRFPGSAGQWQQERSTAGSLAGPPFRTWAGMEPRPLPFPKLGERRFVQEPVVRDRYMDAKKRQRRNICLLVALGILLIIIIAVAVKLTHKSSEAAPSTTGTSDQSPSSASATATGSATSASTTASPSTTANQALTRCLTSFASDAPSNPASYACSDCVPVLTSTLNDYTAPLNDGNSTGVGAALQFCALMDVYNAARGVSWYSDANWASNASPCGWGGVVCDDRGRVTSLAITASGAPATLPGTLANLVSLQSVAVAGNNTYPHGAFPDIFGAANLTSVSVIGTRLTGMKDVDVSRATELKNLWLVGNAGLMDGLPDMSRNEKLFVVSMSHANLGTLDESKLPSSATYLDFSYNAFTGQVPMFAAITGLSTLSLNSNNFTSAPASLPASLTTLNLASNPSLSGDVPAAVCSSGTLSTCDFRSTELKVAGGGSECGRCLFA